MIKGRKRHIMVDTCGNLLALCVHTADIQDRDGAVSVFRKLGHEAPKLRHVFADGGAMQSVLNISVMPPFCRLDLFDRAPFPRE